MFDVRLQNFVIARLADYCDFHKIFRPETIRDPVSYLWGKLGEIDGPLAQLKQQLLQGAVTAFFKKLDAGTATERELGDFKQLLGAYLELGDFVDAAFQLELPSLVDAERCRRAKDMLMGFKAHALLSEESKPEDRQSKNWKKLITEIYGRLEFETLEKVLIHRPLNARRMRFILRRMRLNSADFCAVFRFPVHPDDTFTPFILPRVEALIGANRRFLQRVRTAETPRR